MTSTSDRPARRASFAWTPARVRAAVVSAPMAFWVAALVAVSTVARFLLARGIPAPFIFQDELLYSELAKSLGTTGHFAMRHVPGLSGLSPVYPALISPAYALFDSVPNAYTAAKVLNSLYVSLAAIPAYLIARRLVAPWLALLAAALVLAVPDLLLTGTIMTENAFYPIFLLWFLVLVRMLERPTILNQIAVLALLFLAYETRPQALVFAPALLTAIALMLVAETWSATHRWKTLVARARSYWVTLLVLGGGALLFATVQAIRGRDLRQSLLKTYASLASVNYTFAGVAKWFLYLVSELDIVVGVLPFAAFLVVVVGGFRRRGSSGMERAFAAAAVAATFWIFLGVAAFSSSPYAQRLEERNSFYVMPLLLIGLVVWASRYAGLHPRATGIATTVAVAATGLAPIASFLNGNALTDSFSLLALWRPQMHFSVPAEWISPIVILIAVAAGVLFITVPARFALAVPAVVLLFLVYENRGANVFVTQAGAGSRNGGIQVRHVDWVDRTVGSNADVAFLFTNARPPQAFWQNEFFNRSVDRLYNFVGRPLDGLPQQYIAPDPKTGVVKVVGGAPIRTKYVLTDTSQILDGRPLASDEGVGLRLYRVPGRVRVIGGFAGIYPDAWSGPTATFTANACPGGRLSMRLTGDPDLVPHPQTIVARSGARELGRIVIPPRHFNVPFSIPLVPKKGVCTADFTISPTGIPKLVFNRPDSRVLGIRFLDVRYEPAR